MKLLRLGRGPWTVVAVVEDDGSCPTLDGLAGVKGGKSMLALLRERVPRSGPQYDNTALVKRLKPYDEGLCEFRKQPRGAKLRTVFFDDGACVIVCTSSFQKTDRTPRRELERARRMRERYYHDRGTGSLEITDAGSDQ